ncbi:TlyA family RNA methyltransferase [Guggenheimella bovis]
MRADLLLVTKGLVESRNKAKELIEKGAVYVGEEKILKPSTLLDDDAKLLLKETPHVSRAYEKLRGALEAFPIEVKDSVVLDVGASTGGFTELLIERGAKKVYALDVGTNQLHPSLKENPKVEDLSPVDIRDLKVDSIEPVDLITVDVSFISSSLVIGELERFLKPTGNVIYLFKPQFEMGKRSKPVIRDSKTHRKLIEAFLLHLLKTPFTCHDIIRSPLKGTDGNQEFFMHLSLRRNDASGIELKKLHLDR